MERPYGGSRYENINSDLKEMGLIRITSNQKGEF